MPHELSGDHLSLRILCVLCGYCLDETIHRRGAEDAEITKRKIRILRVFTYSRR